MKSGLLGVTRVSIRWAPDPVILGGFWRYSIAPTINGEDKWIAGVISLLTGSMEDFSAGNPKMEMDGSDGFSFSSGAIFR